MEEALKYIEKAIDRDDGLAWGWHCQFACAAQDEGVDWSASQKIARRCMAAVFNKSDYPSPEGVNESAA